MPTPEININQIIVGIIASVGSPAFIFICYKIYQIFSKPTEVKITANKEASEKADRYANEKAQHSEAMIKLLIEANEKYFNGKFDAQNEKFDTFSRDIKKIVDKHDTKIDMHSETLIRYDDRIKQIEKDKDGIGRRLNDVCSRLSIIEQKKA